METGKIQTLHNYETGEAVIPRTVPRAIVAEGTPKQVLGLVDENTVGLLNGNDAIVMDDTPTEASDLPVKSGGVYGALQKKSGKNLLINSDFRATVNQRNQLEYTTPGYTIDMWRIYEENVKLIPEADGLVLDISNREYSTVTQYIERPFRVGDALTFSILVEELSSPEAFYIEIAYPDASATPHYAGFTRLDGRTGVISTTVTLPSDYDPNSTGFVACRIMHEMNSFSTNSRIKITAAKLELGTEQTLARKEGDTWVLNEIPDYGEELAKCQRYFRVISGVIAIGTGLDYLFPSLYYPPMRVDPSVSVPGGIYNPNSTIFDASVINAVALVDRVAYFQISNNVATGDIKRFNNVWLDADL